MHVWNHVWGGIYKFKIFTIIHKWDTSVNRYQSCNQTASLTSVSFYSPSLCVLVLLLWDQRFLHTCFIMLSPTLIIANNTRSPSLWVNWQDKSYAAMITNIPPEETFTSFFSVEPRPQISKTPREGKSRAPWWRSMDNLRRCLIFWSLLIITFQGYLYLYVMTFTNWKSGTVWLTLFILYLQLYQLDPCPLLLHPPPCVL